MDLNHGSTGYEPVGISGRSAPPTAFLTTLPRCGEPEEDGLFRAYPGPARLHLSHSVGRPRFFASCKSEFHRVMAHHRIRTVVVPFTPHPALRRALCDVRSATNDLVPLWRSRPDWSRFRATKASYPHLRARYPHLASAWMVTIANETSAVLSAWDRTLRRLRRSNPDRFASLVSRFPRRRRLMANLHCSLFRIRRGTLDITLHRDRHLSIRLDSIRHPLFRRYGEASHWKFGLTVTDSALLFHFHLPLKPSDPPEAAGVDLNFGSALFATTDGRLGSVDLTPVVQVQHRMDGKLQSIQRRISKDLRHQRSVLRRYNRREHHRVAALLHLATNQLLREVGERRIILEDLTSSTQEILQRNPRGPAMRRLLSRWTHGEFARMIGYKAHTPVLRVDPRGTSSECPRCGGRLAPPSGRVRTRETVCGKCGSHWHRDCAAAIAVLARGCDSLRGGTVPP